MGDRQDGPLAPRHDRAVFGPELIDLDVPLERRVRARAAVVKDVEQARGRVVGRERHGEHAALPAGVDEVEGGVRLVVEVEESALHAVLRRHDPPVLLNDELPVGIGGIRRHEHWRAEVADQPQRRGPVARLGGRRNQPGERERERNNHGPPAAHTQDVGNFTGQA